MPADRLAVVLDDAPSLPAMELPPALPLIVWPTRLVAVVATLRGYKDVQREKWHRNTSTLTFVIYQRVDALGPNYVANFAFESGVFVHFIQTC